MATEKERANDILGYRWVISIAGMIGLMGGLLFGIWDGITVLVDHGLSSNALGEILTLFIYSVSIYAAIGCAGMAVIGAISGVVVRAGKYRISRSQLARVFIGVFVLLTVSVVLAEIIIFGNIIDIVESTVIGMFCGVGVAALIMYALVYFLWSKIQKERVISLLISMFVSLVVFLYVGLIINLNLLTRESFYHPIKLLIDFGLLVVVSLLGVGLYKLSLRILERSNPRRIRQAGYILLSVMLCAFVVISFIGPFSANANRDNALADSGGLDWKPNILWIVMDTVRADHLSCYGYHRDTTPNIDEIASEGVLYENAISAAPWTVPSHASMFTGTFPSKHGTDAEHLWLEDDFQTIAEVLGLYGYETFGYSNNLWIQSNTNLNQGFNTFEWTNMGEMRVDSELASFLKVSYFFREVQTRLLKDDGAHRTNKVVKRWIHDANQAGTPFFLFINYMEAHMPYHPPEDYVKPYLVDGGIDLKEAENIRLEGLNYIRGKAKMSAEDFRIIRAQYDGELSYLDFKMGQLFDYLRELDILDNTVLIVTSDHGENFGEHQLVGHILCVYDTLLHIPLIIRYPESFEAGLRVSEQVQPPDIFPTILDIVGIDWDGEQKIQGHSLLRDREQYQLKFTIAEHAIWAKVLKNLADKNYDYDVSLYARRLKTVRTEEYKYIWASDGRDELYNIQLDPGELNNIIGTEPEKADEMREQLKEWLNSFEPYRPETNQQVK